MANNRELSQVASFINVDDSSRNIGIATTATPYVGIGTTNPEYKLDVYGDINFTQDLYKNGQLFVAGVGVGSDQVNPQSGIITNRIGVGFTDINFVGTGISITGYGSTIVVDFTEIAAASGGALSISTVFDPRVQDVSFVGGASTSIIGISTQTDRFVYDTQTGSVGIGTSGSSIPQYKLDVVGDINSSTAIRVGGNNILDESVRLAIAFG
jgi:hypothetical protein